MMFSQGGVCERGRRGALRTMSVVESVREGGSRVSFESCLQKRGPVVELYLVRGGGGRREAQVLSRLEELAGEMIKG